MDTITATNRFGLGASGGDARAVPLEQQIAMDKVPLLGPDTLPDSQSVFADYERFTINRKEQRSLRQASEEPTEAAMTAKADTDESRRLLNEHYRVAVRSRFDNAIATPVDMAERLVHFWSNHFAISADTPLLKGLAGSYENEAIRPNIFGSFADLCIAAVNHPAMLIYLDQWKSVGPNSPSLVRLRQRGKARGSKAGLNENLAREILELHMMGARSGYSQDDVRQLALALTGRTIAGINGKTVQQIGYRFGVTYFDTQLHEPGIRKILDQNFLDHGEAQATNIIKYIARLPQTATFLATKLARHFVADTPPEDLVNALASAYLDGNGSLSALYRTLIAHPAAWSVKAQKILTPWEWTIAAFRALSLTREQSGMRIEAQLADMGQTIWTPRSPAGFGDSAAAWLSPSMMMQRAQIAQRLAVRARRGNGPPDQNSLLRQRRYNPDTLTILRGAASMDQWTVLALMAPEFVRR